ncbi:hypothetical protein HMSSN036_71100 [Paenibacillus macerans]|nr:hypothetical protein HMSSN036_71100 [Paenibacillus macerans]
MDDLLSYEREYWSSYRCIAGIDEVGRGCLFGDVVAAAVILPQDLQLEDVNDSKKLSPKKREKLYDLIMEEAVAVGIGYADAATIDRINIKQASRLAMKRAVEQLAVARNFYWWMPKRSMSTFRSWRSLKEMRQASRSRRPPLSPR